MPANPTTRLPYVGALITAALALAISLVAATPLTPVAHAAQPCPNEAVRDESDTNPATGKPYSTELPECRAYELVSAGDKGASDAMLNPLDDASHSGTSDFGLVAENGDGALWVKEFETYSEPNGGTADVYAATRGTTGWSQSDALVPPGIGGNEALLLAAASSDLSTVLLETYPDAEAHSGGSYQLIDRGPTGSYATILSIPDQLPQPISQLSPDGSRAFFETTAQLAGDTHTSGRQLYEWTSAGGVHVVGVNNRGESVSPCGASFAAGNGDLFRPDVSRDGSRVFFDSPDLDGRDGGSAACDKPVELYVRENGTSTVEISKAPAGAAECEPGITECEATFVGASEDGSKVFFITRSDLIPQNPSSSPNLYEYDLETGTMTRLSAGPPGYDNAELTGLGTRSEKSDAVVSSDGSHVYFTGLGQLVPGVGASTATNQADDTANLYGYTAGRVSFIATVGPGYNQGISAHHQPPNASPLEVGIAEVTPNGADLVFDSDSQLTSFDNQGYAELYRYDASTNKISCISCSPAFASPDGLTVFQTSFEAKGAVDQLGGVSNDGKTVFFASTEQLLPAARNAVEQEGNPIYDVYEWHDGVLSLISSGTSPSSDFLVGASPSGSDVFFTSNAQLVPQDGENGYQIYDARTEGGFPAPVAPAPCERPETCRSMAATPPATITPASVSVSGPGNARTVTGSEITPTPRKAESRAEKLAKALKACKRDRSVKKREACERAARKHYGPVAKKHRSK